MKDNNFVMEVEIFIIASDSNIISIHISVFLSVLTSVEEYEQSGAILCCYFEPLL